MSNYLNHNPPISAERPQAEMALPTQLTGTQRTTTQRTDTQLAAAFAALSNPHRLALFRRLTTCCSPGTSCSVAEATRVGVGDLGSELAIAPSTVSHHLKTLRNAGLVCTERRGKHVECWVDPSVLRALAGFFSAPLAESRKPSEPASHDPI